MISQDQSQRPTSQGWVLSRAGHAQKNLKCRAYWTENSHFVGIWPFFPIIGFVWKIESRVRQKSRWLTIMFIIQLVICCKFKVFFFPPFLGWFLKFPSKASTADQGRSYVCFGSDNSWSHLAKFEFGRGTKICMECLSWNIYLKTKRWCFMFDVILSRHKWSLPKSIASDQKLARH